MEVKFGQGTPGTHWCIHELETDDHVGILEDHEDGTYTVHIQIDGHEAKNAFPANSLMSAQKTAEEMFVDFVAGSANEDKVTVDRGSLEEYASSQFGAMAALFGISGHMHTYLKVVTLHLGHAIGTHARDKAAMDQLLDVLVSRLREGAEGAAKVKSQNTAGDSTLPNLNEVISQIAKKMGVPMSEVHIMAAGTVDQKGKIQDLDISTELGISGTINTVKH